jgi:nitroreductase
MCRAFDTRPIEPGVVDEICDLARRHPSAGNSQGLRMLVLEGALCEEFWSLTLPMDRRASFRWRRLPDAPVLILFFADPEAYLGRYSEPDKASTGLGDDIERWPTPYWTVDSSMGVMLALLAAEERGLGALFFALFAGERDVRSRFGIPDRVQTLGVMALGHPAADPGPDLGPGRSSGRPRHPLDAVVHRGRWSEG